MIIEDGFTDLLTNLVTLDESIFPGTFVGYSVDKSKRASLDKLSRLDGIFTRNINATGSAQCCSNVRLNQFLDNRDELLSDHLPIFVTISY
jgi:hypothetical protein